MLCAYWGKHRFSQIIIYTVYGMYLCIWKIKRRDAKAQSLYFEKAKSAREFSVSFAFSKNRYSALLRLCVHKKHKLIPQEV